MDYDSLEWKQIQYGMLVRGLQLLALPAEEQIRVLPDFVDVPFECIDDFENGYLLVPQIVEAGLLSEAALAAVNVCHQHLEVHIFNDPNYDEPSAFSSGEAWQTARRLADAALAAMGEAMEEPDMRGVTYVGGQDALVAQKKKRWWDVIAKLF